MQVDIIVGGQFGSESKGLAAHYVATINDYDAIVCVNSSQAGHTAPLYDDDGHFLKFVSSRQLPSSCLEDKKAPIFIGPGAVLSLEVLLDEIKELEELGVPIANRLVISELASVITPDVLAYARSDEMERVRAMRDGLDPNDFDRKSFGSTKEGVSQALSMRASRMCPIVRDFADTITGLFPGTTIYSGNITEWLHDMFIGDSIQVLVEGSQGWGLSFFQPWYPKCTSRDCSASGFMSMAGLPPRHVRHVYGVFRTYPIRVAGNSGEMHKETTWEQVTKNSGLDWNPELPPGKVRYGDADGNLTEKTTVTQRIRRVGHWDQSLFEQSVRANGIDRVIITFMNYINFRDYGITHFESLSEDSKEFLGSISRKSGVHIWAASTSKDGGWVSIPSGFCRPPS